MTTTYAAAERAALSELFDRLGPEAPTLCEGWATRDLAAHLVMRERRPDALLGALVKPLAAHADRVKAGLTGKPWAELVDEVRSGPPRWSPTSLPVADELANTVEFFVHHEDARRAQTGWAPRALDSAFEDALWRQLRTAAKLLYRRARVGVVLRRQLSPGVAGESVTARAATPTVTVTGLPSELLLHSFGRTRHARVAIDGDPDAVRIFATTPLAA